MEERKFETDLSFLDPGKSYTARLYFDDPDVDTPTHVGISTLSLDQNGNLEVEVKSRNGFAAIIEPDK